VVGVAAHAAGISHEPAHLSHHQPITGHRTAIQTSGSQPRPATCVQLAACYVHFKAATSTPLHLLPAALILLQVRVCRRQSAAWQAALQ
jgi:hypothetical protein